MSKQISAAESDCEQPVSSRILLSVGTPGQYVGSEPNSVVKDLNTVALRVALAFPDVYGVGMSYHGQRILYELLNSQTDITAERVYAPEIDMERELRENNLPLTTLENRLLLARCDLLAVSLTHELGITNLLTMLELGRVPLTRFERSGDEPVVLAGGHATFNPEPFSDFFDAFLIGEGEEAILEVSRILMEEKKNCPEGDAGALKEWRTSLLLRLAREVEGVYVPEFYKTETLGNGSVVPVAAVESGVPFPVKRRVVNDFGSAFMSTSPVVPVVQAVHERVTMEIMRGCPNGCRFCQAGMVCRPQRERSVESLCDGALKNYLNTGYDEVGLLSLSTSNYSRFGELVEAMDKEFAPRGVSLSLPSLRVDDALSGIPERFKTVRKSGLTIAPEAATDRLRQVINKDVTNDNLLEAAVNAYKQGWKTIKLYFMVGLPTETDEEISEIGHLSNRVASMRKGPNKKHAVTCSVSNFVPKPHTPFQWEPMDTMEELTRKQRLVGEAVNRRKVSFKGHGEETSHLEGVFARGDRRLGKAVLKAWQMGARMDGWSEHFKPELWKEVLTGFGLFELGTMTRDENDPLPWGVVDIGVTVSFLKRERQKSRQEQMTPACGPDSCGGCGMPDCPFHAG